uniref:transposase n=1 Tax=Paenibacillus sp. FSL H3-0457 TaxID=2921430 RepID=UPI00403F9D4D
MTHAEHKRAKLFTTIDYKTYNSPRRGKVRCNDLSSVFGRSPVGISQSGLVIVSDNAHTYHSDKIQLFLHEHPRLRLFFLPKYSPQLNPVVGL